MVSVVIFCHDKREADFFCKLCGQCVAVINNERLQCCILSDEDYEKVDIERIPVADLILAEVMSSVDLRKLIHIRKCSPNAKLLILSSLQISPEYYMIPEISPDMLLLKPYIYSKAYKVIHKIFSWMYRDRYRRQGMNKILQVLTGGEYYYFDYADISYLEARDKKIMLHLQKQEFSFYSSLQKLESSLPDYFVRCHRSYIVNFMFIQKADVMNSVFYLDKKTVIPISQKYKAKLVKIFQRNNTENLLFQSQ